MAEHPYSIPTALADGEANWAFNQTTGVPTAAAVPSPPDASQRLNGLNAAGVPDEVAPDDLNYIGQQALLGVNWLAGSAIRQFDTLREGVAATEPGDLFAVRSPAFSARMAQVTEAHPGVADIVGIATDGEYVYIGDQAGSVYAVHKDEPDVAIWTVTPRASAAYGVATDGARVYVFYSAYNPPGAEHNLFILNRATGATLASSQVNTALSDRHGLCTNGNRIAWRSTTTGFAFLDAADTISGFVSYSGKWPSGSTICHCMTDDALIVGGVDGVGEDMVRAFALADGTERWLWSHDVSAVPAHDVASDGEYVYVATGRALYGGTNASVFCLNLYDGAVVWQTDLGVGIGAYSIAADDRYVWVADDDSGGLYMLDKRNGLILDSSATGGSGTPYRGVLVADGQGAIAGAEGNVITTARNVAGRLYQRVAGDDEHRRPFFTLAVPATGL